MAQGTSHRKHKRSGLQVTTSITISPSLYLSLLLFLSLHFPSFPPSFFLSFFHFLLSPFFSFSTDLTFPSTCIHFT